LPGKNHDLVDSGTVGKKLLRVKKSRPARKERIGGKFLREIVLHDMLFYQKKFARRKRLPMRGNKTPPSFQEVFAVPALAQRRLIENDASVRRTDFSAAHKKIRFLSETQVMEGEACPDNIRSLPAPDFLEKITANELLPAGLAAQISFGKSQGNF